MPARKQDQVRVACPHCGHSQAEPRSAFSTLCKKCGRNYRVQEALHPAAKPAARGPALRHVLCFECGAGLDVPVTAESTMCKWCSRYVDLHDYRVANSVARNFKTRGELVVEPRGCVFNTESIAGSAIIRGKYHGKLSVEGPLTVYSTAEIKGQLSARHLIIPADNHFRWPDLPVTSADIAGDFAGRLCARGKVTLRATARFFGDINAADLVIEEGAVVVGQMRIGTLPEGQQTLFGPRAEALAV